MVLYLSLVLKKKIFRFIIIQLIRSHGGHLGNVGQGHKTQFLKKIIQGAKKIYRWRNLKSVAVIDSVKRESWGLKNVER